MIVPATVHPDKVAAYIRWSTDEQSDGTTLEVQLEACKHYIAAQGWSFNERLVFIDDGYSGGSLDRPGLARLRAAIAACEVQCVVVFKLDRLSRSVLDTVKLVLEEWDRRCYVKSAREPVDTSNPNGKMFFYMLASYGEWERNVIKERTMSGKVSRARQGKNPGFVHPYGYRRGPEAGTFALVESESEVVGRIFREYLSGVTFREIAVALNRDGVRPRRGREWHPAVVKQIVVNPIYTGTLVYGRTTQAPFDLPLLAEVPDAIPALVTAEEFERAQVIKAGRAHLRGKRAAVSDYLLTGIIRCRCGYQMEGHRDIKRGDRYYRCASYRNRETGCGAGMISAIALEAEVLARVREVYDPSHRAEMLRECHKDLEEALHQAEVEVRAAQAAIDDLARRRQRLDAAFDAGDLPARLYARRNDEMEAEAAKLAERQARAEAGLERVRQTHIEQAAVDSVMVQFDGWSGLNIPQKKELFRWAVESLIVHRQKRARGEARNRHKPEMEMSIRKLPWVTVEPL